MDPKIYAVLRFSKEHKIPLGTASIAMAAEARGVPWRKIRPPWRIEIGKEGSAVPVRGTRTPGLSHQAIQLCSSKRATAKWLRRHGLPVPKQAVVQDLQSALRQAELIGKPVVIKPIAGTNGEGVSVQLWTEEEISDGYRRARCRAKKVIVEQYIEGRDYRILVVQSSVVAVAYRKPASVIGDGSATVQQLLEFLNSDVRRSPGHQNIFTTISADDDTERMLRLQGFTMASIPRADEEVRMHSYANLSGGGITEDVTPLIHPDNKALAVLAASAVGAEIAGVDFLCNDISQSYLRHGGAICEINCVPGLRVHLTPVVGVVQDVGGAIVQMICSRFQQDETRQ